MLFLHPETPSKLYYLQCVKWTTKYFLYILKISKYVLADEIFLFQVQWNYLLQPLSVTFNILFCNWASRFRIDAENENIHFLFGSPQTSLGRWQNSSLLNSLKLIMQFLSWFHIYTYIYIRSGIVRTHINTL